MSPDQVALEIYTQIARWVDVVVVFDDPAQAQGRFVTPYAETVARTMAEKVRGSGQWTKVFTVDNPVHGNLAGYRWGLSRKEQLLKQERAPAK